MSATQQTLAQLVRSKYPNAYNDMNDRDLEKAVLAKHPEYSDLPRTTGFGPGLTAPSKIPPEMTGHPEQGFQPEDVAKNLKAAAEVLGSTVGGEALPAVKGLLGLIVRITGSGVGAGAANAAVQGLTTGKVNPEEALKTGAGFAAGSAVSEVPGIIGSTRDALKELFFKDNSQLTDLGKAIVHPTTLPEYMLRNSLGVPAESTKAVPIMQSPAFDPGAYRAGVAARTAKPEISVVNETPTEPSKIVTPLSPPPPINRTLVSYDRNLLVHMARGGDLNALRELIRNPGGIDVASAVPNSKFLLEGGAPTNVYGGPK